MTIRSATFFDVPALRQSFIRFVRRTVGAARVATLERLVERGDVEAIAVALNVRPSELSDFLEDVRTAYRNGGDYGARELRRLTRAEVRFDVRNLRAEQWLREQSSTFVTRVISEQREAIRVALDNGARRGLNPRTTALDIVGRIDTQTGRRVGGVVGLTPGQASAVTRARLQLASAEADVLREYLRRGARDKRFDAQVAAAIREGRAVPASVAQRASERYADNLLRLRGETIARTEAMHAFNAGREEAYEQAMEDGTIRKGSVTRVWDSAGDGRVRDAHVALNNDRVPWDGVFVSPTGARMRHPGDTSLGAGPEDVINCRCVMRLDVDYIGEATNARR